GGEELGVEGAGAGVALPAPAFGHDLVDAVLGEGVDQPREVAGLFGQGMPLPERADGTVLLGFGVPQESPPERKVVIVGHGLGPSGAGLEGIVVGRRGSEFKAQGSRLQDGFAWLYLALMLVPALAPLVLFSFPVSYDGLEHVFRTFAL